ncbi:MAG: sel1 repeat family protein, partial [Methanomassiliicoccaceae archaeon]|nr:sel1 repeat family protein [Methanomassiliicoccaceae archaeon]
MRSDDLKAKAAEGSVSAMFELAQYYALGTETDVNEEESFKWYSRAADLGHTASEYMIGECYSHGIAVPKDDDEAIMWYVRAADKGDRRSIGAIALYSESGREFNAGDAFSYYRREADAGHPGSMYMLARCYYYGVGVQPDISAACRLYEKAAGMGHIDAMYELALMY